MTTLVDRILGMTLAFATAVSPAFSQSLGLPYPSQDAQPAAKADIVNGRFVTIGGQFGNLRIGCVQCHGLDGAGNSSGAFPRLSDQSGWYLYKTLQDYASGLRPSGIMQPIANALTVKERHDVAAYYASIKNAPYPPKLEADVQTLQHGGAIAAVGIPGQGVPACNGCHGPRGIGNGPIYPYLAGQFASYLQDQLILWKHGKRDGDPMNIMERIAKAMTEDQIHAVSIYYAMVRPGDVTPDDRPQRPGIKNPPHSAGDRSSTAVPIVEPSTTRPPGSTTTTPSIVRPPYLSPKAPSEPAPTQP